MDPQVRQPKILGGLLKTRSAKPSGGFTLATGVDPLNIKLINPVNCTQALLHCCNMYSNKMHLFV